MSKSGIYIAVALARAGIASRRKALELIRQKRVRSNGIVVDRPIHTLYPGDTIQVDEQTLNWEHNKQYIMLNKPPGYLCTHHDPRGGPTIFDLLKPKDRVPGLTYVGRLDQDSSGLLLLTNDGQWAQHLQHPRYEVRKTYHVIVNRPVSSVHLEQLKRGTLLDSHMIVPDALTRSDHDHAQLQIILHSGQKRVIRRLLKAYGYAVITLHRTAYGSLALGSLASGSYRPLEPAELKALAV